MTALESLLAELSRHGEALALGDGLSVVTSTLRQSGTMVDVAAGDWPSIQLGRRYPLVIVEPAETRVGSAAIVHCAAQHVERGGEILVMVDDDAATARRFDLDDVGRFRIEGASAVLYRRSRRTTIHDKVFEARSRIVRVTPGVLAVRLAGEDPPTVVDTRTATDRGRYGVIAGSLHVPRTVVEWHLDPANGYRHPAVRSFDQPLVLVCNGGYSSSLAAANLLDLGFSDVGDLIGGIRAWIGDGNAVVAPDHTHLDI